MKKVISICVFYSNISESCAKDRIFSQLLDMFPNVDPTFVKQKYVEISKDPEALENFILETTDQNNYPTYEEYKRYCILKQL